MGTGLRAITTSIIVLMAFVPALLAQSSEVPAGTRFLVELRDKLEAKKNRGKDFQAWTLEALRADDGSFIPAGAKLKGRMTSTQDNRMLLRFDRIETGREKLPVVATVLGVAGDRHVRSRAGEEGEISTGGRGKSAGIGAAVGAGVGAAVGATQGGGKGAAIGAGTGAAAGAVIGAASGGGHHLVLEKGTRVEVQLDRPLVFSAGRR